MAKILILDNYDSFTYNLVHHVRKNCTHSVEVIRNDEVDLDKVTEYDGIILSPGPGIPEESGLLLPLIKRYAPSKKILGVCLGEQAIGEAFGAELVNMNTVFHGVALPVNVLAGDDVLFRGIAPVFLAGRYHSWIVNHKNLPDCLEITAIDNDSRIMALRHKTFDVRGVQFHPESIMTDCGEQMIKNWLNTIDN